MSSSMYFDEVHSFGGMIRAYPRQAVAFFAAEVMDRFPPDTRFSLTEVSPLIRYDAADDPLQRYYVVLAEKPDGGRSLVVLLPNSGMSVEEYSIFGLADYCLDLSRRQGIQDVIPVVIFRHHNRYRHRQICLRSTTRNILQFSPVSCTLDDIPASDFLDSDNIVARICLPTLRHDPAELPTLFAKALTGLMTLDTDFVRAMSHVDLINQYTAGAPGTPSPWSRQLPLDGMSWIGLLEEAGTRQGIWVLVSRLLTQRFGAERTRAIRRASNGSHHQNLKGLARNVLAAGTPEEVFRNLSVAIYPSLLDACDLDPSAGMPQALLHAALTIEEREDFIQNHAEADCLLQQTAFWYMMRARHNIEQRFTKALLAERFDVPDRNLDQLIDPLPSAVIERQITAALTAPTLEEALSVLESGLSPATG